MAEYVVYRYEENYPNDSYFYAVVFDTETKKSREVLEWSTAFGGVNPDLPEDATPEIREVWARHQRAVAAVKFRRMYKALAEDMHLSHYTYARKLHTSLSANLFSLIYDLLKVKNYRSAFRAKLAQQVREWCIETENKYSTPLSPKQIACITPQRFYRPHTFNPEYF